MTMQLREMKMLLFYLSFWSGGLLLYESVSFVGQSFEQDPAKIKQKLLEIIINKTPFVPVSVFS